ncbi:MAG: M15 family metallopeptidase [Thermoanaerobaculia bacterium]|nr:M15 family metallopeptidase [Thermoanaerobaculia bacterium]
MENQDLTPRLFRFLVAAVLVVLAGPVLPQDGPPAEPGPFREADLVELTALEPGIRLDVKYARSDNFLGRPVYREARAFLQRPAAEAVARAHRRLAEKGFGLMVFDGYRPWAVTKAFWDATPEEKKLFVANPKRGSRHNRGCSVDLTLYHLETGKAADMGSGYDEFSPRSYATLEGGTKEQLERRELLRGTMEREGFFVYPWEWWHFDFKDWRDWPLLDVPFEKLGRAASPAAVKAR